MRLPHPDPIKLRDGVWIDHFDEHGTCDCLCDQCSTSDPDGHLVCVCTACNQALCGMHPGVSGDSKETNG